MIILVDGMQAGGATSDVVWLSLDIEVQEQRLPIRHI
jgi:hypothetical protein